MKFSELSKEDQEKILTAVKAEVYMQNLVPTQHFFYVRPVIKAFEEVMEEFEKKEKPSREMFFPDKLGKRPFVSYQPWRDTKKNFKC